MKGGESVNLHEKMVDMFESKFNQCTIDAYLFLISRIGGRVALLAAAQNLQMAAPEEMTMMAQMAGAGDSGNCRESGDDGGGKE